MRQIDDTDREIIRLLVEDARRPYNEIAETVGLSPPTVSDRVERLQELGVIRRFTVDLDHDILTDGLSLLVTVNAKPGRVDEVKESLASFEGVEHVFVTADAHLVCKTNLRERAVETLLSDAIGEDAVLEYDVQLLVDDEWNPQPGTIEFVPDCVECGNTVTSEGESTRIEGELYHFCCPSCRSQFADRYERLQEGVAN
ncbi:AsnC family transcriptional regulator [Haladaptatus salinisoli]|uniref:AsnC family transcriptional regulator n=1 Tax=Haladaptatus salinisoli TaxID=2884876 RepID=UPI001D0AE8E9|nr:AsnC family transcriptional regulator [Haladaptatus salinisoli]